MDSLKQKELMHLIIHRCNNPMFLGATKLYQIMWLSEIKCLRETGSLLTNGSYTFGIFFIIPTYWQEIQRKLCRELKIKTEAVSSPNELQILYSLTEPNTDIFSEVELHIIYYICDICVYEKVDYTTRKSLVNNSIAIKNSAIAPNVPVEASLIKLADVIDPEIELLLENQLNAVKLSSIKVDITSAVSFSPQVQAVALKIEKTTALGVHCINGLKWVLDSYYRVIRNDEYPIYAQIYGDSLSGMLGLSLLLFRQQNTMYVSHLNIHEADTRGELPF